MKKLAIVLAILMLVPASAFSMQMLSDSGMDQITGQSGVSIAMDDVQLFINIGTLAYIDNDGLSSSATMMIQDAVGAPGALYIQDFQIDVLNINAIVGTDADSYPQTLHLVSSSAGHIPLFYTYEDTTPLGGGHLTSSPGGLKGLENYTSPQTNSMFLPPMLYTPFIGNPITIEVTDQLPILTEGFNNNTGAEAIRNDPVASGQLPPNSGLLGHPALFPEQRTNVGGVFITVPTAEIYIQSLDFTVAYTGNVYAQTLTTIVGSTPGEPPRDMYLGPMGALTSHAINDNQGELVQAMGDDYPLEGDFGSISMRDITFTQLSGWMEIAPH